MDIMVRGPGSGYMTKDVKEQHSEMRVNIYAGLPRELTKEQGFQAWDIQSRKEPLSSFKFIPDPQSSMGKRPIRDRMEGASLLAPDPQVPHWEKAC